MKNKTYLKASLREIIYSKGRFISIVLIILLGAYVQVGFAADDENMLRLSPIN